MFNGEAWARGSGFASPSPLEGALLSVSLVKKKINSSRVKHPRVEVVHTEAMSTDSFRLVMMSFFVSTRACVRCDPSTSIICPFRGRFALCREGTDAYIRIVTVVCIAAGPCPIRIDRALVSTSFHRIQ